MGTPAYLAPEQARGRSTDATDQWALAITAYELLVGDIPWRGTDATHVLAQILTEDPPRASAHSAAPPEADAVLARALEKQPEDRFEDVVTFGRALRRALAGEELPAAGRIDDPAVPATPDRASPMRGGWMALGLLLVVGLALAAALGLGRTSELEDPTEDTATPLAFVPTPPLREHRITRAEPPNQIRTLATAPDARLLFFQDDAGLWRQPLDGGEPERVHASGLQQFVICGASADGRWLLLEASDEGEGGRLALLNVDHDRVSYLDVGSVRGCDLSRDGSLVAFVKAHGISVVAATGGEVRRVLDVASDGFIAALAFSPDGRHIVYRRTSWGMDRRVRVETVSLDGRSRALVSDAPNLAVMTLADVAWPSPDRILFGRTVSAGSLDQEIWEQAMAGGEPQDALPHSVHVLADTMLGRIQPIARGFVVLRLSRSMNIWVADLGPGSSRLERARSLADDPHEDRVTGWTDDGSVLFMSNRFGSWDVFERGLDDEEATRLSHSEAWTTWPTSCGPDCVLYFEVPVSSDGTTGEISVMRRSSTADPVPLYHLPSPGVAPPRGRPVPWTTQIRCAGPERAQCLLGTWTDNALEIRRFNPRRAEAPGDVILRVPSSASIADWQPSPDGAQIAVLNTPDTILVAKLDSGEIRGVHVDLPGLLQYVAWAPGDGWLVTGMGRPGAVYFLIHVAPDGTSEVLHQRPVGWIAQPQVSPDGRHVAFVVAHDASDAWSLRVAE